MTVMTAPATETLPALSTPLMRRSAFVATALGWLVPGLGQFYVGRPGRGCVMFIAIAGLFYAGLRMTAYTAVNPDTYSLEFIAHVFLGGPTALTYYLTQGVVQTEPLPWLEVGRLYAAVAGLLNIVAICDAVGEVLAQNERIRQQADLRQRFLQERQLELDRMIAAREAAEADAAQARAELREATARLEQAAAHERVRTSELSLPGEAPDEEDALEEPRPDDDGPKPKPLPPWGELA